MIFAVVICEHPEAKSKVSPTGAILSGAAQSEHLIGLETSKERQNEELYSRGCVHRQVERLGIFSKPSYTFGNRRPQQLLCLFICGTRM